MVAPEGGGLPTRFDGLVHQTVSFRAGNTTDRGTLDALEIPSYDHVILLSHASEGSGGDADSRTLVSLLHLREIADRSGRSFPSSARCSMTATASWPRSRAPTTL